MFGISPFDLPWWGWILCGFGLAVLGSLAGKSGGENRAEIVSTFVSVILYVAAVVCAVIGVIRFLNWA
jgi:hypothetical protein